MIVPEGSPTRDRVIQSDVYKDAGYSDFSFSIPRPFTAEDFQGLADKYKLNSGGVANGLNQLLAENLGNNMASRIKSIVKANSSLEEGEEPQPLPGQEEMNELLSAYDFSGVRTGSGEAALTPIERALYRYARQLVRSVLRNNGTETMAAPVTVAKRGDAPKQGQVSFDDYEGLVEEVVQGEGIWGTEEAAIEVRQQHVVEAAEAAVAADEKATVSVGFKLGVAA